jgi:hypothetical protein
LPAKAAKPRRQARAWTSFGAYVAAALCLLAIFLVVMDGMTRQLLGLKVHP